MGRDTTMPSTLGYISGLMWNQNNCDSSTSPVTTVMELKVGQDLCNLMNFDNSVVKPWAHLTGCGSVANIEAIWSARNLKLHGIAIQAAVCDEKADPRLKGIVFFFNITFYL